MVTLTIGAVVLWLSGAFSGAHQSTDSGQARSARGIVTGAPVGRAAGPTASSTQRDRSGNGSPPSTDAQAEWVDEPALVARVNEVAEATGAEVGVAVRPLDGERPVTAGPLQVGAAWSTMKVPVILARYRLAKSLGQPASEIDGRVTLAITESDNEAINSLFEEISVAKGGVAPASLYVQRVLEDAGDTRTVVNTVPPPGGFSTFGQTRWSLAEGTRFYAALAKRCLTPTGADERILDLMGEIIPEQSWGLGQARFSAVGHVLFKGGWGPDPSGRYLVRQFGIVRTPSGRGLVVGVMDRPADGTFASGTDVLDRLADAVAESVNPGRAPAPSSC